MGTWLDLHDRALVERVIAVLKKQDAPRWEQSLNRARGDSRFALWLVLVDDLIETHPAFQDWSSPSLPVAQLRETYLAGGAPLDAATLWRGRSELTGSSGSAQPSRALGMS